MADVGSIPPSNLLVDAANPRLSQPNEGQREAMRALAKLMPRKIVALARDIVENGLNPADLPIVMAANDSEKRYVVLEGNRRLVALKALENPDSFVGALDGRCDCDHANARQKVPRFAHRLDSMLGGEGPPGRRTLDQAATYGGK